MCNYAVAQHWIVVHCTATQIAQLHTAQPTLIGDRIMNLSIIINDRTN